MLLLLEVQVVSVDMGLLLQRGFQPRVVPQNEPDGREASLGLIPKHLWCSETVIKPLASVITTHASYTCFGNLGWDGAVYVVRNPCHCYEDLYRHAYSC